VKSIVKETKQKIFTDKKAVKFAFMSAVMLCLVSLFLAGGFISVVNDIYAFVKEDGETEIFIPEGSSLEAVSEALGKAGVIKNPFVFTLYVKSKGKAEALEGISGEILLDSSMSYREILSTLLK
jgi:cell division protein YceG involved in septum cleavage